MKNASVWKYTLDAKDIQELETPAGSKILSVHAQRDEICIWALVDTFEPGYETRQVYIAPTGRDSGYVEGKVFLGTVLLEGGSLVFHVFIDRL